VAYFRKLLSVIILCFCLSLSAQAEEVGLVKAGGVFHIPVEINGVLKLDFIFDTGAAEINIPADVVMTLVRTGTLKTEDFLDGSKTFVLADGTTVESPRFILRSVKVGKRTLRNVPATISDVEGQLILGQSLLEKIGSYTFDNARQVLVLHDEGGPLPTKKYKQETNNLALSFLIKPLPKAGPEDVVQTFFKSVANQKFDESWESLSSYSKKEIVKMVAKEADSSPLLVRDLFDHNHPAVRDGFWISFYQSSNISYILPLAHYKSQSKYPGIAAVTVMVGEEELTFEVVKENGKWKMGLIESLEASQEFPRKIRTSGH